MLGLVDAQLRSWGAWLGDQVLGVGFYRAKGAPAVDLDLMAVVVRRQSDMVFKQRERGDRKEIKA